MSVDQSLTASVVSGVYKNISLESRHLGSLLFLTRKKSTDFNFPKKRPESRYSIKSLAQALYTMSTLIFLNWVWNGMDILGKRFWWQSSRVKQSYMALKAWSELTFESQISFKTDVWWWQKWPLWNKVGTWNFMCFLNVQYHCKNWSGLALDGV